MLRHRLSLAVAPLCFAIAAPVMAQGYYVDEQSALRLGDAFSGGAASASDASAAYYSPAAMILVKDELALNLSAINVRSTFKGTATTGDGSVPINGENAEADGTDVLPTLYFVTQLAEGFSFGAFLNAPYATGTDFGTDSVARYQATESEITGINGGVSVAFRVHDKVSIGGSMIAQYLKARTAVAINTTALCLGAEANGDLGPFTCAGLGIDPAELGNNTADGQFEMEGHNTVFGFAIGTLVEFTPHSRLGLNYRTRIAHDLTGSANVTFPDSATTFATLAGLDSTQADGRVSMTTPETANLSYYHEIGALGLQADVSWTGWSRFDELKIESNNATVAALTAAPQQYDWDDSYRIALGANYRMNEQLTVRGGLAFDKTPIGDENTKIDFAFDDYKAISVGLSYALGNQLTLDAGFQHTLTQKRDIDQNELATAGARLQGEVTTEVNSFAIGLRRAL